MYQTTYAAGDTVKVRDDLKAGVLYANVPAMPEMFRMRGKLCKVQEAQTEQGSEYYKLEGCERWFPLEMLTTEEA